MSKIRGFCHVCRTEIQLYICCNGFECGCMGLPTEPPVCSEKCYDIFTSEEYQNIKKTEIQIAAFNLNTIKKEKQ